MPLKIDARLTPSQLVPAIERLFELSAAKIHDLEKRWDPARGTPVSTVRGRYTSRGWTEWTQGFQYGSAILAFDVDDESLTGVESRCRLNRGDIDSGLAQEIGHDTAKHVVTYPPDDGDIHLHFGEVHGGVRSAAADRQQHAVGHHQFAGGRQMRNRLADMIGDDDSGA